MSKHLSVLVLSLMAFLGLAPNALANGSFTASNPSVNHSTGAFSFDYSGYGGGGIQAVAIRNNAAATIYNWSVGPGACTGSHCSGTAVPGHGTISCSDDLVFDIWDGGVEYVSNSFAVSNIDSSCAEAKIGVSPATANVTVGTPFTVNVTVSQSGLEAFNAAKADIALSKLSVTGITYPHTNSCNFYYAKQPTTSDPSFAGAILGRSSTSCTAFTMTLTPIETGAGSVTFNNASIRAASDSDEVLTGTTAGSYTISAAASTPTPTTPLPQLTVTSPLSTYLTSYPLAGGKDAAITHVYVGGSETGMSYPSGTTWQVTKTLSVGDNTFTIYGSDGTNQTATQDVHINRHALGDINGDGDVNLIDVSLFAVDWGKTSGLTYDLSDMNVTPGPDGNVDLYDLSVLAGLVQE